MRIAVIGEFINPVLTEALGELSAAGVQVDTLDPTRARWDLAALRPQHDLYAIKTGTPHGLALAGALHAAGAATLNPYPTVAMLRNKIVATRMLQLAGVPVPDTYTAADREALLELLEDGPLILKPYRGSRGRGIRVVHSPEELEAPPPPEPLLVQRYHPGDGHDRKLFRIGREVFGVKRVFPIQRYEDKRGEPFEVDDELRDLSDRCRRAFAIDLFSLDVVMSADGPRVVDVATFGSNMGVPGGPRRLAAHLHAAAERARRGDPVLEDDA